MALARVWNDHDKEYREKFEDNEYRIPPKGFIELDRSEAIKFMGSYVPIKRLDNGEILNPKMLRLEVLPDVKLEPVKIVCQMCKQDFQTDKELALHSELEHAEAMADDDAKKAAYAKRK